MLQILIQFQKGLGLIDHSRIEEGCDGPGAATLKGSTGVTAVVGNSLAHATLAPVGLVEIREQADPGASGPDWHPQGEPNAALKSTVAAAALPIAIKVTMIAPSPWLSFQEQASQTMCFKASTATLASGHWAFVSRVKASMAGVFSPPRSSP
jgi:hypothetical protein